MSQVEITFTAVVSVPADVFNDHHPEVWADKALYYGTKHAETSASVISVQDVRELDEA